MSDGILVEEDCVWVGIELGVDWVGEVVGLEDRERGRDGDEVGVKEIRSLRTYSKGVGVGVGITIDNHRAAEIVGEVPVDEETILKGKIFSLK